MAIPEETAIATRPRFESVALSAKGGFLQVCDEKKWSTELMFALQILRGNKMLQECNEDSIKNAIVNIALTGATLNPAMQMAYLVPRSVKGKGMCCVLDFSYRGLIKIATDSGSVKHIAAKLVYTFDTFSYVENDGEQHITHEPNMLPPEEFGGGTAKFWDFLLCGYVVATLFDGSKIVSSPMPKWKLKKAMETSKTSGDGTPWRTHPDEMCLKTLIKYTCKTLPQTDRMDYAIAILNEHEGLAAPATAKERASSVVAGIIGAGKDPAVEAVDAEIVTEDAGAAEA